MQVLIIRHGRAGTAEKFAQKHKGEGDHKRPLTKGGAHRMRQIARGLWRYVPHINVIATSSFTRARQTAQIVARAYGIKKVSKVEALEVGGPPSQVVEFLKRHNDPKTVVAVVGHEPELSRLVGLLTTGKARSIVQLKKGAACLVDFDPAQSKGGKIHWLLGPSQLRRMGRA